jgi:GDPmannose 4,6-dehydratase
LYGHWITKHYREAYGMFNCSGILFNHESERRGLEFVTRKISHGVAKIKLKLDNQLLLGNIEAKRDWGCARNYVEAMWLMLQQNEPDDYVIATGISHSIREFLDISFKYIGINDWSSYVKQDNHFIRPADIQCLCGDCTKAKTKLKWEPIINFEQLVKNMVDSDIKLLSEKK